MTTDQAPYVSSRRMSPALHLREAAKAPLGSPAETYHLQAAIGEALARLLETFERRFLQ
jgi:hypothetical protein